MKVFGLTLIWKGEYNESDKLIVLIRLISKLKANKGNLLQFLAQSAQKNQSIPSIPDIAQELDLSPAALREQLEVARQIGIVEVKPRRGINLKPFSLAAPITLSMNYGVDIDPELFDQYANLRRNLEMAYWNEAISCLKHQDIDRLKNLVKQAFVKINHKPVLLPNEEHRELHLSIYRPIGNLALLGVLEAYWNIYEHSGFQHLQDQNYLNNVWTHHKKMVDAIASRDYEIGYDALRRHFDLISEIKKPEINQRFE